MSSKRILTGEEAFPTQPHDIDASKDLFNAFAHTETEISAGWIIRFMQERDQGWAPFTREEINVLYHQKYPHHDFCFNRLIHAEMIPPSLLRAFAGHNDSLIPAGGGWIVEGEDGKCSLTEEFVERCFKSRPVKKTEEVS